MASDGFPYPVDLPGNFSVNANPTVEQLKPFGYAPGSYQMKCATCKAIAYDVDKRALRCCQCAINAFRAHEINAVAQEKRMQTVDGQEEAERSLSIAIGRLKSEAVQGGLAGERVVDVLRAALAQEERLLAAQRANERTY